MLNAMRHLVYGTTLCLALAFGSSPSAVADERVQIAVAANFTIVAKELEQAFEETRDVDLILSFGSTGKLFTQIALGAPFQVFLSADSDRPERAIAQGLAIAESRFTYATGRIALFSANKALVDDKGSILAKPDEIGRIAIANPKTAPYGRAAEQALAALGVLKALRPKLVRGDNIAQTYQFVSTGNADLGLVALSQVLGPKLDDTVVGSHWIVPETLYEPISQDAVLLQRGADSPGARAFLDFLKSPAASAIITRYGYGTD
ncbi:MAG: molybdate ABC transporter substrate-binding protein [Magnetovibrionaceae bacterium]